MYNDLLVYLIIFGISFFLTVATEQRLVPVLAKLAKQPIYTEGPKWHDKKSGTPTMGGLAFLIAVIISCTTCFPYVFSKVNRAAPSLLICIIYAALNSIVGIIDDVTKLKRKQNAGLSPRQKLLIQLALAIAFLIARRYLVGDDTSIVFSFGEIELGVLYYVFAVFALLGTVNCANLTDGIDGLASGVAFAIGLVLFYISYGSNIECAVISSALVGASVGFLIFNIHPAKIFMGDTGSLFFGALVASAVFALDNPFLIIPIGIVYVIEGISVILQVLFYKATKKRLFLMAPIHHHFERRGLSENTICIAAIVITLLVSVPAYLLYHPL